MLKVVILAGFAAAGMYASSRLNQRIRQLKELHKAMICIERKIDYELAPLWEAFVHTGQCAESPWNKFFEIAGTDLSKQKDGPEEIIRKVIKEVYSLHPWEKDLNILISFGKNLGELDKKMQLSKIKMAQEEIIQAFEEAKEEQQRKGKLYQTLGVCMGILGVIILW